MKKLLLGLCLVLVLISCKDNTKDQSRVFEDEPNIVSEAKSSNVGDNLNLQALGELVKTSANAQDLESKLNTSGSINNLDLDEDGSVDYIKVTEYGSGNSKGFSFTVDLAGGETQEVATIELQKNNGSAQMGIQGNQQMYGNHANYSSSYSLSDIIMLNYLFGNHTPYYSPYHYGFYPSYYHSYRSVPYVTYNSRVINVTRTTTFKQNRGYKYSMKSPNRGKMSKAVVTRNKSLVNASRLSRAKTTTTNTRKSAYKPSITPSRSVNRPSRSSYKPSTSSYKPSKSSYSSSRSSSSRSSSSRSSSSGRRR